MIARTTEVIADGFTFLEAPRWRAGELWMAEVGTDNVVVLSQDGGRRTVSHVPGMPSGIGFLPDGTPLVVSLRERRIMKIAGDALEVHADLSDISPFLNDMVVDRRGRAYVGDMGYDVLASGPQPDKTGNIILVQPDGAASFVAGGIRSPNGCAITSDGQLVMAESLGNRFSLFPIHADGALGERTESVALDGIPDGICIDIEDGVWVALYDKDRFVRVLGGKVVETAETPGRRAIACQLGGDDGKTLFCTTYEGEQSEIGRNIAGRVEVVRVDVAGAGSP